MATSKSDDSKKLLIQEASDSDTDPKRLRELADDEELVGFVLRNPSVPEDTWRKGLLTGSLEAWDNPMALIFCDPSSLGGRWFGQGRCRTRGSDGQARAQTGENDSTTDAPAT